MNDNYPPICPLCQRPRRGNRPLCNGHMRHAGQQVIDRYFLRARTVARNPHDLEARKRLDEICDLMIDNAAEYAGIRSDGFRPHWNAAAESWEHPRQRAQDILTARIHDRWRLRDPEFVDALAAEIVPKLERPQ